MAVNMNALSVAVSNWTASLIDGKVRGFNPSGGSTYGSQGWNDGESLGTGTEYFASTTGSSGNPGTEVSPWPLTYGISQLTAGDTLTLLDGTYTDPITPATAAQSGTEGEPITVRAQTYGNVIIEPTASTPAINFYSNFSAGGLPDVNKQDGWTVDGVICRTNGEVAAVNVDSQDLSTVAQMTNNIALKRIGAFGSAIDQNTVVFSVSRITDCIFEDTFAYGNGRKAYQAFGCDAITIRNAVGRYDYWDGAGYKPNDPRNCMSCYNTQNSLFENIILLDSADTPATRTSDRAGMIVSGNQTGVSGVDGSADNLIVNLISLNNIGNGIENNGGTGSPTTGITFKECVSWENSGYGMAVHDNSEGTTFLNVTSGENGNTGIRYNPSPSYVISDQILEKAYVRDNNVFGVYSSAGQMSTEVEITATGNTLGNQLSGAVLGEIDAAYAPTLTSIVEPVMVSGFERGATIMKRSVGGVLTDEDFWPYRDEGIIKTHMLNTSDLTACFRTGAGVGVPGWKTADDISTTSLSEYVRSFS